MRPALKSEQPGSNALTGGLRAHALFCALLTGLGAAGAGVAQSYPSRPIRLLLGFAPGGSADTTARIMSPRLSERLGQQVVLENRPGAAGNIAADITAKATPNGYTLLMTSSAHTINASLYPKLPFDAIKDFAPVTFVSTSTFLLTVNSSLPVNSVPELIALARSKPGQINYASGGTTMQLASELFATMAGVKFVEIRYKSTGLAVPDLLSGRTSVMFSVASATEQFVAAGKLRALGVTSGKRLASAPNVPTIAEAGLPGYEFEVWQGLLAPAATPRSVIAKLNKEIVGIMSLAEVKERLLSLGLEAKTATPEQLGPYLVADVRKWAKLIRESGARPD